MPTEEEFWKERALARVMEQFLRSYRGDADSIKSAWDSYKTQNHLEDAGGYKPRKFATEVDGQRGTNYSKSYPTKKKGEKPKKDEPSVDEVIERTQRILELHKRLAKFHTPPQGTIPDKFKYHDTRHRYDNPLPPNWVDTPVNYGEDFEAIERENELIRKGIGEKHREKHEAEFRELAEKLNLPSKKPRAKKKFTVI